MSKLLSFAVCVSFALIGTQPAIGQTQPTVAETVIEIESSTWARHFWVWYETGQITNDAIRFRLMDPDGPTRNPIKDGLDLFDDLTGNTAVNESDIWNLLSQDVHSYDAFRHYTMTGRLVTHLDATVAVDHLLLAAALPEVFTTAVTGDYVVSKIDKKKKEENDDGDSVPDGDGDGVPDEWEEFWEDLNDAVDDSGLADIDIYIPDTMPDPGIPFWPFDNTDGRPGFDCDDYATAMINYLENEWLDEYPDAEISYLHVYWGGFGHSMVLIEQDGVYFVVDPQTGEVVGPFNSIDEAEDGVREILDDHYNYDEDDDVVLNPSEDLAGADADIGPFYEDPDILEQFEEALEDAGIDDVDPYLPNDDE
ncbi:MAG: hypothetical protein KatS3mg111_4372 [Pirellulaceae bacterium]|nr:MAG: hypothetical protein KatS3mg111_4372 [Pirellulaceae bacterium]